MLPALFLAAELSSSLAQVAEGIAQGRQDDAQAHGGEALEPGASDRDETMIPCDVCDTMVRFCDFLAHSRECRPPMPAVRHRPLPPLSPLRASAIVPRPVSSSSSLASASALLLPGRTRSWLDRYTPLLDLVSNDDSNADETADGGSSSQGGTDEDDDGQLGPSTGGAADNRANERTLVSVVPDQRQLWILRPVQTARLEDTPTTPSSLATRIVRRLMSTDRMNNLHLAAELDALLNADDYDLTTMIGELMGGNVRIGVTDVDAVTTREPCPDADTVCPICQDNVGAQASMRVTRACHHTFCSGCIETWLRSSKKCPVCMLDLEDALEGLAA